VAHHNNENGGHPGGSVLAFKEMMGMKMKRVKTEQKPDAAEEIAPEEVESVTPTTDVGEAALGVAGSDAAQMGTQH
jgi:hypothetical protein